MTRKSWTARSSGALRTWTLGALFGALALLCNGSKAGANVSMMAGPAQMTYKSGAEYIPAPLAPLYVLKGTTVTFRTYCQSPIMGMPAIPGAKNWSVTAAGATGVGASILSPTIEDTVNVSFTETSANINDYKVVHAKYNLTGDDDASVNVVVYDLIPIMTPDDDFEGRSQTDVGIGETGTFSYTTNPLNWDGSPIDADILGGLDWKSESEDFVVVSGIGDGTGTWTAGTTESNISTSIYLNSGVSKDKKKTTQSTQVRPKGVTFVKVPQSATANIYHVTNKVSAGFNAAAYLTPSNVSFANLTIREGDCTPTGYWILERC